MNKSNIDSKKDEQQKSINKSSLRQNQSSFSKFNLQHQYEPKVRVFKHKILKTDNQQKNIIERLNFQKQEQRVVCNALQCFRKGEIISIDWKTKSNFRKSEPTIQLPKILNQQTESKHKIQNIQALSMRRSNRFNSFFESRVSHSVKNRSISDKQIKLKQLLFPSKLKRKSQYYKKLNNEEALSLQNKAKQQVKSIISKKTSKQKQSIKQIDVRINSRIDGKSQNMSNYLSRKNSLSSEDLNVNFAKLRSNTENFQRQNMNLTNNSIFQSDKLMRSNTEIIQKHINKIQSKKVSGRNGQNYDILEDPAIYFLISKSRQKIIDYKQKIAVNHMPQIQRFKYLDMKKKSNSNQNLNLKNKSLGSSLISYGSSLSQQKIIKIMKEKKKEEALRLSKLGNASKIYRQCAKYIKSNQNKSQTTQQVQEKAHQIVNSSQFIVDEYEEKKWEQSQSKIKRKKRETLIEVQQRLLKRVKLSYLKQDLTKKFQQIRSLKR